MAGGMSLDHPRAFVFGILGNAISFMVYLAPVPTFYRIHRKKSTEGFQSVPYVVALFSAMLWMFYALIKRNAHLLITINSFGCVIETTYIIIFLIYASKKARAHTIKMVALLNMGLLSLIILCVLLISSASLRLKVLGWICVAFSVAVFVAPLSIIREVIRTRTVEFMPFNLSLSLSLSAVMWFAFGLFSKDIYVALPNVLGFTFGVAQMLLYIIYKDAKVPKSLEVEENTQMKEITSMEIIVVDGAAAELTIADEAEKRNEIEKDNIRDRADVEMSSKYISHNNWRHLGEDPYFLARVVRVKVFVASDEEEEFGIHKQRSRIRSRRRQPNHDRFGCQQRISEQEFSLASSSARGKRWRSRIAKQEDLSSLARRDGSGEAVILV
ncbi:bidirectional sugar transporter SWEET13-like [Phalaenopsis equestris]|uniref:bidirectional sugar transporter SWEET13-like n=1 Tax=Phalaenopsis equestris TaxID=78828 RepID=UPI0009E20BD1|nr:bidirectional sugar transporter SWEET13-like [Phalaenopsis equestris]